MNTVYEFRYIDRDDCVDFREAAAERFNIRWVPEDNGIADEPLFIFKHFVGRVQRSQELEVPSEYGRSNVYQVFLSKVVRSHQGCGIHTASVDRKNKLGGMYFCYGLTDEGCLIHSCAGNASNLLALESVCSIYKKKIPSKDLEDELKEMKSILEKQEHEIQKLKENNEGLMKEQEAAVMEKNQQLSDVKQKMTALADELENLKRSKGKMSTELQKEKSEKESAKIQLRDATEKLKHVESECKVLQQKYDKVVEHSNAAVDQANFQLGKVKDELKQVKSDHQALQRKYDRENSSKYEDELKQADQRLRPALRLGEVQRSRMLPSDKGTTSSTAGSRVTGRTYEKRDTVTSTGLPYRYGVSNMRK